ncbi:MAG: sigma-70 family RNA polymerase sigma factor [Alphaproteobacteria bacterium]
MNDDAAAGFEPHRRHLIALAYRMLGSRSEAEDIVQDAYLRWHRTERAEVAEARGFLTTVVTRLCLDHLKSARVRRESYVGPWLPEPVLDAQALSPERSSEIAEDLTIALLMTMERLSPLERAAFLLHDVFELDFAEVASTLDRSPAACRQLAARARTQVQRDRPRYGTNRKDADRLVRAFKTAAEQGDVAALVEVLAGDVVLYNDAGGRRHAALNPIFGRDRFLRFVAGIRKKDPDVGAIRYEVAEVNGRPGLLGHEVDGGHFAIAFDCVDGRIVAVYTMLNPDKLTHLPH